MLRFNFVKSRKTAVLEDILPDLVFIGTLIAIVGIGNYAYVSYLKGKIEEAQKQERQLRRKIENLHRIQKEGQKFMSLKEELRRKLNIMANLNKKRKVPAFLYFFSKPQNIKGIWLDSILYSDSQLLLTGGTLEIKNFPKFLSLTENKLGEILFKNVKREIYENRSLGFKQSYYEFNFGVRLKYEMAQ